jgi:hypothetical protein
MTMAPQLQDQDQAVFHQAAFPHLLVLVARRHSLTSTHPHGLLSLG